MERPYPKCTISTNAIGGQEAMNNGKETYFGITVDPLHIGSGGYRLGRVDNTIVRDPGTDIPKVPGSSISGVCRNYAIYGLKDDDERKAAKDCAKEKDTKRKNNCGSCAICKTFGFASGSDSRNQIGKVKFFDAGIVAFPVATMAGPVWVTTASILKAAGADVSGQEPGEEDLVVNFDLPGQGEGKTQRLNLGWLFLPCAKDDKWRLPDGVDADPAVTEISRRLVLAPDWLFSEIVNSNLEVRTSVSIDFETGAAESGKLFTYEAIPRATLLAFDVVIDENRCTKEWRAEKVKEMVKSGMGLFEHLGIGGMNTRGFGRLKIVNL